MRVYYEKLGHMLKHLVPKFRPDLSARIKYIAEKRVPAKLKPILVQPSTAQPSPAQGNPAQVKSRPAQPSSGYTPSARPRPATYSHHNHQSLWFSEFASVHQSQSYLWQRIFSGQKIDGNDGPSGRYSVIMSTLRLTEFPSGRRRAF